MVACMRLIPDNGCVVINPLDVLVTRLGLSVEKFAGHGPDRPRMRVKAELEPLGPEFWVMSLKLGPKRDTILSGLNLSKRQSCRTAAMFFSA